ncbi:MAG: DEAD/DEAH box helicase [Candidatus Thorarchaeota archaeon]
MSARSKEVEAQSRLRNQLKALSNRHAIEILQVLNPQSGEMVPTLGWDSIVEGLLALDGILKPVQNSKGEKTQAEVAYEEKRQGLMSGGTIYETMNKLVKVDFVISSGDKGRKQRGFMITHEGRLALASVGQLGGPIGVGTEVQRAAKTLLKHKNFVSLLPAQKKFVREFGNINENLVIQMPPGSGKTFLAMIVILLKLQEGKRCFYMSPYTSLSRQIIDEYGTLLNDLGYSVVRHDGIVRATDEELENANLTVVMYETFASALLQKKKWTDNIGLTVIDELTELDSFQQRVEPQNIGTDRSVKLDLSISLLRESSQIITLSSRFGESEEITDWLNATIFRPDVRLTPDEFIVSERDEKIIIESSDGTQKSITKHIDPLDAIMDHLEKYDEKSILIVVGSRYGAQSLARSLSRSHPRPMQEATIQRIVGTGESLPLSDRLASYLQGGVAFHHSGLDAGVRQRLEIAIKERAVRTVVSTTGITSGMSLPFDCVVVILDPNMYFLTTRSRYLQIAGRIGEYHLGQYGGRIYIVYEGPSRVFPDAETMEETLLHKPLAPLNPGPVYPSLAVSVLVRSMINGRAVSREDLKKKFLEYIKGTLRGTKDAEYTAQMSKFFGSIFKWLTREKMLEDTGKGFKITKESRAAILAGIDPIDYLETENILSNLAGDIEETQLIDVLLKFRLPQAIRPRTLIPSVNELKVLGLEAPSEWYMKLVPERLDIKRSVLQRWIDEQEVATIIKETGEKSRGISLDEGDLDSLLGICSTVVESVSRFFSTIKKKDLANRFNIFSRQLQYGVHADLAGSDLLELHLMQGDSALSSRLSRNTARILYDNGYTTISDVIRKDIDASKKGLARDRFSQNCGLDIDLAKEVYKAAMMHIRAQLEGDDDDDEF